VFEVCAKEKKGVADIKEDDGGEWCGLVKRKKRREKGIGKEYTAREQGWEQVNNVRTSKQKSCRNKETPQITINRWSFKDTGWKAGWRMGNEKKSVDLRSH